MLKEYAKRNGFLNCRFYVDDGYSGTNYDRPAFRQLIEDIRYGEVATIITKDLSRLGRNYLETGTYIEVFFPNHNVRYIAINDGVDSIDNTQMDITPFRNIINEMYSGTLYTISRFRSIRYEQFSTIKVASPKSAILPACIPSCMAGVSI